MGWGGGGLGGLRRDCITLIVQIDPTTTSAWVRTTFLLDRVHSSVRWRKLSVTETNEVHVVRVSRPVFCVHACVHSEDDWRWPCSVGSYSYSPPEDFVLVTGLRPRQTWSKRCRQKQRLPGCENSTTDIRLRLRLIYLGRMAENVKYITYLGCAPARKEGSRTENWKIQENKQRQKEIWKEN